MTKTDLEKEAEHLIRHAGKQSEQAAFCFQEMNYSGAQDFIRLARSSLQLAEAYTGLLATAQDEQEVPEPCS